MIWIHTSWLSESKTNKHGLLDSVAINCLLATLLFPCGATSTQFSAHVQLDFLSISMSAVALACVCVFAFIEHVLRAAVAILAQHNLAHLYSHWPTHLQWQSLRKRKPTMPLALTMMSQNQKMTIPLSCGGTKVTRKIGSTTLLSRRSQKVSPGLAQIGN